MVAIVIPALDPDDRLPGYVAALRAATDAPILLVDDGSGPAAAPVFDRAAAAATGVSVVRHDVNRGKGRALKTAFATLLEGSGAFAGCTGCVTADADGQHEVADVLACARALEEKPEALVLGCRRFDGPDVPWRSSFGNNWMRSLFRMATGRRFLDTQTGLRGIPASFMRELLDVPGERFEFESRMLVVLGGRELVQLPIRTVYEDGNKCSHFRPLVDSAKILRVLGRPLLLGAAAFTAASLASFGVDIGVFCLLRERVFREGAPARLFLCVAVARCVSVAFNYLCNRFVVFRPATARASGGGRSLPRYLALAVVLLFLSWLLTKCGAAAFPSVSVPVVKAVVDLALFIASYAVQRAFVFRP